MKNAIELRTHIINKIGSSLLGTRTYPSSATKYNFTAAGDVITATGATFTNGDTFRVFGDNLPSPLAEDIIYYAVSASGSTCKASLTLGGAAIALTTAGSGVRQLQKYVVEAAVSIIPDPQFDEGGFSFPSIVNGSPVTYQGIEAVIYNGYEGNQYSALLNSEARLDSEIWILLKDWNTDSSDDLTMAALYVSQGLYILETKTPPNPDNAPLVKSIILVIGFAGYL
jgi:hypothetical protein